MLKMKSLNEIRLLGYVGGDPECKFTSSGTPLCRFSLATTARWKGERDELKERTEWHTVVCWSKLAETVGENLKKGAPVLVSGELRYNEWVKDEQNHKSAEIHASDVVFLPRAASSASDTKTAAASASASARTTRRSAS